MYKRRNSKDKFHNYIHDVPRFHIKPLVKSHMNIGFESTYITLNLVYIQVCSGSKLSTAHMKPLSISVSINKPPQMLPPQQWLSTTKPLRCLSPTRLIFVIDYIRHTRCRLKFRSHHSGPRAKSRDSLFSTAQQGMKP